MRFKICVFLFCYFLFSMFFRRIKPLNNREAKISIILAAGKAEGPVDEYLTLENVVAARNLQAPKMKLSEGRLFLIEIKTDEMKDLCQTGERRPVPVTNQFSSQYLPVLQNVLRAKII